MNTWTAGTKVAVGGYAPDPIRSRISRLTASIIALLLLAISLGCPRAGRSVGKEIAKVVSKAALEEAAGQAGKYFGEDILHEQRLRSKAQLQRFQSGQTSPNQTSVGDLQGTKAYQTMQLRVIPNVWGGWNYYTLDNQPVGFSVPEVVYTPVPPGVQWTGRYFYFDPWGNPIY
jgi:hypothetical protein